MKDWLDKLSETRFDEGDEPPKGFFCSKEIGKRKGMTRDGAAKWMRRELESGRVQMVKVRRPTSSGKIALIPYYGPKKV